MNIHAHPRSETLRAAEAAIVGKKLDALLADGYELVILGDYNSQVGSIHTPGLAAGLRSAQVISDPGFRLQGPIGPGIWVNSDQLPVVAEVVFGDL